jgi:hypothetical protein
MLLFPRHYLLWGPLIIVLILDFLPIQERRSNHTFTPPTSSLSNESSSNDLHLTLSSVSVDLPQLSYAIEKFLVDDDNPVYQIAEEFPSGYPLLHQGRNIHISSTAISLFV